MLSNIFYCLVISCVTIESLRYLNEQWKLPFHATDRELKNYGFMLFFVQGSWGQAKEVIISMCSKFNIQGFLYQ